MPAEWGEQLQRPDEAEDEPYAILIAASTDDRFDAQYGYAEPGEASPVLFLWTQSDGSSSVVLDLRDSPGTQVFAGDFDGRYVAFSVYNSAEIFASPWVGYVYDVQTPGPPQEFARSTEEAYPDGTVGALPLMSPLVRDGTVYWVAFDPLLGDSSERTLFSYDVVEDTTRPLATGKFDTPHFFDDSILAVSMSDDRAEASIVQIPLNDHVEPLPDQLAGQSRISHLAASGDTLAWIADGQVFILDSGASDMVTLVGADGTFGSEVLQEPGAIDANDEVILFYAKNSHDALQQYIYDRRSGSYFSNEDLDGASADFGADAELISLHHTDKQGNRLLGRPVVAAMEDLPPLPSCS